LASSVNTMAPINHQEQQLRFLIWFLRKRIHEILSDLNKAKSSENGEITDILKNILEMVTLTEYLEGPIDKKIEQLSGFKFFIQTLSGTDIHGHEAFRRGPDVD
jgi:hypothetical protein